MLFHLNFKKTFTIKFKLNLLFNLFNVLALEEKTYVEIEIGSPKVFVCFSSKAISSQS